MAVPMIRWMSEYLERGGAHFGEHPALNLDAILVELYKQKGSILDTDSECKSTKRKRSSVKRLCKHCNKKKRKHKSSAIGNEPEFECHCDSSIANLDPPSATSIVDLHYPGFAVLAALGSRPCSKYQPPLSQHPSY
ncbi:hypothetical protein ACJJTC_015699 [Scirpophaga incertulas]